MSGFTGTSGTPRGNLKSPANILKGSQSYLSKLNWKVGRIACYWTSTFPKQTRARICRWWCGSMEAPSSPGQTGGLWTREVFIMDTNSKYRRWTISYNLELQVCWSGPSAFHGQVIRISAIISSYLPMQRGGRGGCELSTWTSWLSQSWRWSGAQCT